MKPYNRSFTFLCLLLVSAFCSNASAGLVTEIPSLLIDGTRYDVTFHRGQSFNDLWDGDADETLGEADGSMFNSLPTFWGDSDGAKEAAEAIVDFFGASGAHGTSPIPSSTLFYDGFTIPFRSQPPDDFEAWSDFSIQPDWDTIVRFGYFASFKRQLEPLASFAPSVAAVPEPATLALMGLGVVGVGWSRRKRTQ